MPGDLGQPARPYSAPDQLGGNSPRQAEFASAANSTGDIAGNSALNADSERFNALVPRQVGLESVLQTAMPSFNGIGTSDQQRLLPTGQPGKSIMLPSQNGSSPASWQQAVYMHLNGDDEI
jgi:hypothetical protein